MAELYDIIEATFEAFLASYERAVKDSDPKQLLTVLAPTCVRRVYPVQFVKDMGQPGVEEMDNESYLQHMGPELAVMEDGRCEIKSLCIDTTRKTAMGRVDHHCKLPQTEWMTIEFVWQLDFEEDGKTVKAIAEILDCHGITKFVGAVQQLMATQAAVSSATHQ